MRTGKALRVCQRGRQADSVRAGADTGFLESKLHPVGGYVWHLRGGNGGQRRRPAEAEAGR